MDQYVDYCYTNLTSATISKEILQYKDVYEYLTNTSSTRVFAFIKDNVRLSDLLFKRMVKYFTQKITY